MLSTARYCDVYNCHNEATRYCDKHHTHYCEMHYAIHTSKNKYKWEFQVALLEEYLKKSKN